jgi:hypothetical protein
MHFFDPSGVDREEKLRIFGVEIFGVEFCGA